MFKLLHKDEGSSSQAPIVLLRKDGLIGLQRTYGLLTRLVATSFIKIHFLELYYTRASNVNG